MRIFGTILAGGQGRRLGGVDKALLRLGGETLLERAAGRLGPQVERLALSANGPEAAYRAAGLAREDAVLPDPPPGDLGPLAGVLAGLDWAGAGGADWLVTAAVDTPFLPCDLVPRLLLTVETAGTAGMAMAASGGRRHPTAALWPVALRDELAAELAGGLRKLGAFGAARGAALAEFATGPGPDPFFNINTAEDLAAAGAALR
ncbi:molybdenum cofactor guanylyltransferase MobA [Rhodovulum sulfidophilum]|uniref:Molybdenum cofactor guanylyltransferase n=1 Tax=Rhodovulum sulfidophilum TaxID=35806 RepID=A0ABS1RNG4_RHOSU|nr:molybdenum cofactor guanylyltransferase MobA [Rhodovulum sulfidophilum]MBL3607604.1 molybdenum cofactor guanylyltransferase [Rhodovulum sulfidophilum]MCE8458729.1 molybdenum cofactor guanylyltransferase [Rhodovulum sulfidophilum]